MIYLICGFIISVVAIYFNLKYKKKNFEEVESEFEDGITTTIVNGTKSWYKDGLLHRAKGPAVIRPNGDKEWWLYGKRHRKNGPAIEYVCGTKIWYLNGKLHRDKGPAVELFNGVKGWYHHGLSYRELKVMANGRKTWRSFTTLPEVNLPELRQ